MVLEQLLGLVGLVCAVWVIYDVWAVQKRMQTGEKVVWTVLGIVFSILTAIIYYFMKKR